MPRRAHLDRSGRLLATTVLAVAALAVLPSGAGAADTVITFEDQPDGKDLTTEYLNAGGTNRGVEFAKGFQGQTVGQKPEVETVPAALAQSGTKVADIQCCGGEFPESSLWGRFPFTKQFVRIFVGSQSPGNTDVTLQAYRSNGTAIAGASQTKTVTGGAGYKTELAVASATQNIKFFRVEPPGVPPHPNVKVDDLTFDNPDTPPPPDFGVLYQTSQFAPGIGMKKGESVKANILINRDNGSFGPIDFHATDLPNGVTASFEPDNTSADLTTMTLTASKNASTATDHEAAVIAFPITPGQSPGNQARNVLIPITVLANFDLQVNGIEVTQAIQTLMTDNSTLPARNPGSPNAAVPYQGVGLAANGKTIARVFANVKSPLNGSVSDVTALLHGKRGGKTLTGSPLSAGPKKLDYGGATVAFEDRASQTGAFTFTLPPDWTAKGNLELRAELVPTDLAFTGITPSECETQACADNNKFTLKDIPFTATSPVKITPVALPYTDEDGVKFVPPHPVAAFDAARAVLPLGEGQLETPNYLAEIEMGDIVFNSSLTDKEKKSQAHGRFKVYADLLQLANALIHPDPFPFPFGINPKEIKGVTWGSGPSMIARTSRPLRSMAHELIHGLGQPHASKACGGGTNGETGEDWPPDEIGWIQGIGVDRRQFSGGFTSQYKVIAPDVQLSEPDTPGTAPDPDTDKQQYDLMSYCGPEANAWISTLNWTDLFNRQKTGRLLHRHPDGSAHHHGSVRATPAQAGPNSLRVTASVDDTGGTIHEVAPAEGPAPVADPASPYRLVTRDAAGSQLTDTPMATDSAHESEAESGSGLTINLHGQAPIAGAQSVQVVSGGTVLASRTRSANVPSVRVTSPGKGATVGRGTNTTVRWTSSDADGGQLLAKLDYSTNDGRSWRPLTVEANRNQATVPSSFLTGSRRARLRVRLNDGFNEGSAVSERFVAVGRPPSARILSPAAGSRQITSDAPLFLSGEAYDDAGRALRGKRLRWLKGRKRLGSGNAIAVRGLKPGRHRIRLEATDGSGRKASSAVTVRVSQAVPQFLALTAPKQLSTSAKVLKLKVASTVPATLKGGGKRFAVDRKRRGVRIPVTPGSSELRISLQLRAGKRITRLQLVVPRS